MKIASKFPFIQLLTISTSIIAVVLVTSLFSGFSNPTTTVQPDSAKATLFEQHYVIHALPMPEKLDFAGEAVPLDKWHVRERYDREILVNTYWQSQTLLLFKRANRYFPVIEAILKAEGVPDDFKYLALIESGLLPRIVSPSGAAGIWQFMESAAKDYKLEISKEVDERYHLEKSTIAACRYLKKSYAKYGNWTLAAASYNAGPAGIDRHIGRQKVDNYYDLLLTEETGRYLFRILATKEIFANPKGFGFYFTEEDLYAEIPYDELEVTGPITDFADFAKEHNTTYREFKDLNPWLRETFLLNPFARKYTFKMPK